MKRASILTLTGLVALGLIGVPMAQAAPKSKQHVTRKAGPKKPTQGGVSTTSQDIDGDGTADVVVASPPRPKPKPKKH
ncbi:MAG TPA: hypothetical protein VNR39_02170 [Pseudolabrys sp.]|nr:hypothetical protein [Pseudolabrys sp.]